MKINYLFWRQTKTLLVRPASKQEIGYSQEKEPSYCFDKYLYQFHFNFICGYFPCFNSANKLFWQFLSILSVIGTVGTIGILAILNGMAVMAIDKSNTYVTKSFVEN